MIITLFSIFFLKEVSTFASKPFLKIIFAHAKSSTAFLFIVPDTFVNLEPSKKKSEEYDKDYIIYQNLIGFQPYVGAKLFNNAKMISIIPRIWLSAFSGEKISKPCKLVGNF